nr:ASCH domain-containing protein [Anabaena sp. AL93]
MAKKHSQATATQEPALFSTELYSSGTGDIERQSQDPYWDQIILDSGIIQTELSGQTTLFYDPTTEPPTPEEFNSVEAYNAAYDSLCVNHPELVNHGFKTDFEEDRGFKIDDIYNCLGQRIFSQKENRKGAIAKVGKSGFVIDWDGWVTIPYSFTQIEELQLSKIEELDSCLQCSTPTPVQEQLPLQVTNSALEPPNLLNLTTPPNKFLSTDSQTSPFTTTSEPIKGNSNGITSTGYHSLVPEQVTPESVQGLTIQSLECGSIPCERSPLNSLNLLLLNNPEELLTTDLEQFLEDSEWLSTVGKIQKSFQQRNSAHPTNENEFSLLPTPTTYPKGSTGCRPAGTNRLEQKLRPFIHKGDKLHPSVAGWMMGFPIGWVEYPLADTGEILSVQLPLIPLQDTISKTDGTALTSTDEQLHLNKQRSLSKESVTLPNSQELETATNLDNQTPTITKIKAITLHQPWASLIGKYKHYETRGKATNYRGKIAIHAAIRQETTDYQVNELADLLVGEEIPFGSVIAIAQLTDCIKMTEEFISQQSETELRCGLWEVGRYAWKLENVEILDEPIPARGMPGSTEKFLEDKSTTEKFLEDKSTTEKFLEENSTTEKFLEETLTTEKFLEDKSTTEKFLEDKSTTEKFLEETLTTEKFLEDKSTTEKFLEETLTTEKFLEDKSTTEKFLEDKSTTEKFLEDKSTTEKFLEDKSTTEKFLEETLTTEKFLEDKSTTEKFLEENSTTEKCHACGCLYQYIENKKLKNGSIVSYPRVDGERNKHNYGHWRWGYSWEEKINGKWRNRSVGVSNKIVHAVENMINNGNTVQNIREFIALSKNKEKSKK